MCMGLYSGGRCQVVCGVVYVSPHTSTYDLDLFSGLYLKENGIALEV